jgi:hypothetical protein
LFPEPQNAQATRPQIAGAPLVALHRDSMLAAVELDREASLVAIKIEDIGRDRVRAAELPAAEPPVAEDCPKPPFRVRLLVP